MSNKNIAIIGNGVYGMALAFLFGTKHNITVFGRVPKDSNQYPIEAFDSERNQFEYLIISITTKGLSDLLPRVYATISEKTHIILAMKGLTENGLLPIEECRKYLPKHRISVLSGPGFADDILTNIPVHLVLAGEDFSEEEEEDFLLDNLTLDFTHDVRGVSWCGVLKNIYAIGAGMASRSSGFDRSHYTREAVHEMALILEFLHCQKETAHGPAGRGDMWICTTPLSRNFRFGAGEKNLAEQAEGYNALIQCNLVLHEVTQKVRLPLLQEILTLYMS